MQWICKNNKLQYTHQERNKIFLKGYSFGYRSLLNSELASAVSFYRLYGMTENKIKQDTLVKILQRESKELKDPFNEYYLPRRLKEKTV